MSEKQCVNCPGRTDHTTAECWVRASLPDGYMPIPTAEQMADALENVRCFHDLGAELIAPELLANLLAVTTVKESLSVAPSLPAAGSAEEEVEVVAWMWRDLNGDMQFNYMHPEGQELMTVAQHERIVAALSAQKSAPDRVSVQVKLLRGISFWLERTNEKSDEDIAELIELRALLTSHGRGEA